MGIHLEPVKRESGVCVPLRAVVERLVDLQRYGQQVAERGGPDGTTVVVVVAEVAALRGDAEAAAVSGAAGRGGGAETAVVSSVVVHLTLH